MEDVLAVFFIFGGGTFIAIAFSPVGRAIADRLRHGKVPIAPVDPDPALWGEIDRLTAEVSELQERVEFSERLLTTNKKAKGEES